MSTWPRTVCGPGTQSTVPMPVSRGGLAPHPVPATTQATAISALAALTVRTDRHRRRRACRVRRHGTRSPTDDLRALVKGVSSSRVNAAGRSSPCRSFVFAPRGIRGRSRDMRASRVAVISAVVCLAAARTGVATSAAGTPGAAPAPKEVLTSLTTDLGKVRSLHVEDVERDKSGRFHLSGDFTSTGSLRLRISQAGETFTILAVGRSTFLRGNRAYWASQGASSTVAGNLADHWVKRPAKLSGRLRRLFTLLTPTNIAYCLQRSTGTLSSSTATLNGRRVNVLTDRGDRPGSAPGKLYSAASGPPAAAAHRADRSAQARRP